MRLPFLLAFWCAHADAQSPPQQTPIRALAPIEAKSAHTLGRVAGVRPLPDGRVLVNDTRTSRLLVFDSTLRSLAVLADSSTAAPIRYAFGASTLIPYTGDSTLFVDVMSRSFIVIDPSAKAVRIMATPKERDVGNLISATAGLPSVDARGRLVYRGTEPPKRQTASPLLADAAGRSGTVAVNGSPLPDSAPIVRADFETRVVDTIGRVKAAQLSFSSVTKDARGYLTALTQILNPVGDFVDEWAVMSDGFVAIVRAHDYHVDWYDLDGRKTSTPKMAYDWRRLTDLDKQRKLDSAQMIIDSVRAVGGYTKKICNAGSICRTTETTVQLVPLAEVPDYVPPFRAGAVMSDLDGNLWILPTTTTHSIAGELLYDVINRSDGLFERVRVPVGKSIVGFGRGGIVYLVSGDLKTGFYLERARIQ